MNKINVIATVLAGGMLFLISPALGKIFVIIVGGTVIFLILRKRCGYRK